MFANKLVAAALVTAALGTISTEADAADWRNVRQEVSEWHHFGLNAEDFSGFRNALRAVQRTLPVSFNAQVGFDINYVISNKYIWLANNGYAGLDVGFAGYEMDQATYRYLAQARVDDIDGRILPRVTVHSWTPRDGYTDLFDSARSQPGVETPGYNEEMRCQYVVFEQRDFGVTVASTWYGVRGWLTGMACRGTYVYATPLAGVSARVHAKPDVGVMMSSSIPGVTLIGSLNASGDTEGELQIEAGQIQGNQACISARGYAEFWGVLKAALTVLPGGSLINEPGFDHNVGFTRSLGCHSLW